MPGTVERRRRTTALVSLVILFATGLAAQDGEAKARQHPKSLALLVGINTYAGRKEAPSPLRGTKNDIDRAERVLLDRFGFEPDSIVKLVDADATHEKIVSEIYGHLIKKAGPKTKVVFWFSGHGSRIPDASHHDPSPREMSESAMDQTLVAYDSRMVGPYGSYDITDDELHSLFAEIKSRNVLIVTDCCHSGGALRGNGDGAVRHCGEGTRPLSREHLKAFWPNRVRFRDDDEGNVLRSVVHLSACGAQQLAGEYKTALGWFGTMTWFLTTTLKGVDENASWQEVARLTRARVAGFGSMPGQRVQAEGDVSRGIFGGDGRPVPPGYPADRFGPNRFVIAAGRVQGVGEGARFRLHDVLGKELGSAEVTRVKTSCSHAKWLGKGRPPKAPVWAIPTTLGNASPRLRISPEPVGRALLEDSSVVEVVADRKQADFYLREQNGIVELLDLSGRMVRKLGSDPSTAHPALFREHCFRSLWQGVARSGMFRVELAVEKADAAECARLGLPAARLRGTSVSAAVLDPTENTGGGLVKLVITNHSDEDLHVAVLSLCENREVNVVFGGDTRANNVIGAHKSQAKTIWLGPHPDWPADKAMVDRYVAVATSRYADFKPFESTATVTARRGDNHDENLPPFLRRASGKSRGAPKKPQQAWGIANLDLLVMRPQVFDTSR